MKFKDFQYNRIDYDQHKKIMTTDLAHLKNASTKEEFLEWFNKINKTRAHVMTMSVLCTIRHSIDTSDKFYDEENTFWDEHIPKFEVFDKEFMNICLQKKDELNLTSVIYDTFFSLAESGVKTLTKEIVPLLIEENKLQSKYDTLLSQAKIPFNGKILNISDIRSYQKSVDRNERKAASFALMKFFKDNQTELDTIYDQLVSKRTKIANLLGYENFIELGYLRMNRQGFDQTMVAKYRKEILDYVTPLAQKLYEQQANRLEIADFQFYDMPLTFKTGSPKPIGTYDEMIEATKKMYHEMSSKTAPFIDRMIEDELWDLQSRNNKQMGGYMTEILDHHVAFIFSNFNGTSEDVVVLTHEVGHAFNYNQSAHITIPDLVMPTMEAAEIHSMSMEFFAHPWMELFFGENADRYRYNHVCSSIQFLPYGALVDHFQHEVYANPNWTIADRKKCWRTLEKQYLPYKKYDECELLEEGCWWYMQGHIFDMPFYYIDYTLAQVCAQQFFIRSFENDPTCFDDYLHLCTLGGTKTFIDLVKEANLVVPFTDGCIQTIMDKLSTWLNNHTPN